MSKIKVHIKFKIEVPPYLTFVIQVKWMSYNISIKTCDTHTLLRSVVLLYSYTVVQSLYTCTVEPGGRGLESKQILTNESSIKIALINRIDQSQILF